MSLAPNLSELIARAHADLRMGVPIVLTSKAGSSLTVAVENLTQQRLNDLAGFGDLTLTITARRAQTLKIYAADGTVARLEIPKRASLDWIKDLVDPSDDLSHPMKGPFKNQFGGNADRHRAAIDLIKAVQLLPAAITVDVADPMALAAQNGLTLLPTDNIQAHLTGLSPFHSIIHARVPLIASDAGRVHVFRPEDGGTEHFAIEIGHPDRTVPVLARLHSACFTGDIMGSLKCDCGPQLQAALSYMGEQGHGVLLYLNQEGRGIGHANKMRAYALQDQGFDTVEANHRLGFEDDERDFRIGSAILKDLGFSKVRLLTNNPAKIAKMEDQGLHVTERVPLKVGENAHNTAYLATKADKSGHLL